jgi:hypothetical protein
VQSLLRGTAAFSTVDVFLAQSAADGGSGTPTASQLAAYHAVLAYDDNLFADPVLLGDRLAAYHDQGGGVVVSGAALVGDTRRLQGAYGTPGNGYALLDYAQGAVADTSDSLGDVLEPLSPLMAGVASLSATAAYRSTAPLIAGRAVEVARWRSSAAPLVLRGMRGNRTLVELNFIPTPWSFAENGYWVGDGASLMRNALKYSRCLPCGKGTYSGAGAPFPSLFLSLPLL